ncbi:GAF domain-containing sensor histidine kinase [Szabonella alba]|uniref:GAF domain-containing protein n=1 Tax=Szabonella alba TaxID=2804194 RepID=A0A8K0Y269_9RHOB|nr:GAF domain-containing sensor histidine kinase [Szabonella alba]MBL4918842.1 GAF domain-containing protein [Szabonella alba]
MQQMVEKAVPVPLLRHFFNITRHLAGHLDFASAIAAVADEIAQFLPYDHIDVCMLQADGRTITAAYESGLVTDWARRTSTRLEFSPIRALLAAEVDFILTPDATCDPRFAFPGAFNQPILEHGLRARVHVPLSVKGDLIGALSISSRQAGRYGMREVEQARYVADILSPHFHAIRATEQARQSALTEAQARRREEALRVGALELTQLLEHERQRIGMDLHDQTLADLTRLLRDLRQGGAAADRAVLAARLQDCVEELRRTIDMAAPTILELFGFAHAVRIHLERAVGDDPIAIQLEDRSGGLADGLAPTARIAMFRIAQEAINNAVRHSGAKSVTVRIGTDAAGGLRLDLTDDGCGLPGGRVLVARGGLAHMQTRARLIAADFDLDSDERGTQISVHLPAAALKGGVP